LRASVGSSRRSLCARPSRLTIFFLSRLVRAIDGYHRRSRRSDPKILAASKNRLFPRYFSSWSANGKSRSRKPGVEKTDKSQCKKKAFRVALRTLRTFVYEQKPNLVRRGVPNNLSKQLRTTPSSNGLSAASRRPSTLPYPPSTFPSHTPSFMSDVTHALAQSSVGMPKSRTSLS
jgi:hypothetical protein